MSVDPADYACAPGAEIGDWRVVRPLGRGGMAEVYEVEAASLGSRYALKLFTYARGDAAVARERFFAEGRLLAKLDHPRLVRVYDVDEDRKTGRPYFVMDLVIGPDGTPCTLADAGIAGADEDMVARWYEDLRDGLAYIHGRGILHRDLKLQNVLIGPDGHAVIGDFGVAKIFNPELRSDLGLAAEQTLMAARNAEKPVMGSVGYMAPEVEMGVAASKESDYYALGVIVFRLLTGVWCDSRTDVVGDLETYNPTWRRIVPKLLHSNPAGRECPSWNDLERERREEDELRAEKLYMSARDKLRRAKNSKKWLVAMIAILSAGLFSTVGAWAWKYFSRHPSFEDLCPTAAEMSATGDSKGEDDEGTSSDWELARIDAWAISHGVVAGLASGSITRAEAVETLRQLSARAAKDDDDIFMRTGSGDYDGTGVDLMLISRYMECMANRLEGVAK